jgi:hypothetical protein
VAAATQASAGEVSSQRAVYVRENYFSQSGE